MKKIMAVMLSLLACTVLLAGCNTSSESNEEQSLKVYSFSGENEYISVSNGVIILDGKDEICYGGDLKVMSDDFANITTYSTTIYINGSEKETQPAHHGCRTDLEKRIAPHYGMGRECRPPTGGDSKSSLQG